MHPQNHPSAMDHQGPPKTPRPPNLNQMRSISQLEDMDVTVSLTSGASVPLTVAIAPQPKTTNAAAKETPILLDTELLEELGLPKEDIGKLLTTLLVNYIRGALHPTQTTSQQGIPSETVSPQASQEFQSLQATDSSARTFLEERSALHNGAEPGFTEEYPELDRSVTESKRRRRKRHLASTEETESNTPAEEDARENKMSTQIIVLKPICKENVKDFKTRDIRKAIEKAGITTPEDYRIQIQPKANTIALTTRNEKITEKLLQVTELQKGGDSYALRPYKAMGSNQARGVIYLHGNNSDETPETLIPDLECRTAKVVYARLMGTNSNAVVITFEGTQLPKKVMFCREIFNVKPYRPRPIVCYNCHMIGHKTDVCPSKQKRCGSCGYIHDEGMEECTRDPQCTNCGGSHVATSNNCPKRKIPEKKKPTQRQQQQEGPRQQRESYSAAAKAALKDQQAPPTQAATKALAVIAGSGSNQQISHPSWIPEWAMHMATKSLTSPPKQETVIISTPTEKEYTTKAELRQIEARIDTSLNKLERDMNLGFRLIFEAIGEIKRDIAELKHGR